MTARLVFHLPEVTVFHTATPGSTLFDAWWWRRTIWSATQGGHLRRLATTNDILDWYIGGMMVEMDHHLLELVEM